jgi:hypothetical protein
MAWYAPYGFIMALSRVEKSDKVRYGFSEFPTCYCAVGNTGYEWPDSSFIDKYSIHIKSRKIRTRPTRYPKTVVSHPIAYLKTWH